MDNDKGYLNPTMYDVYIGFGESFLHHENWFTAICLFQFVEMAKIAVRNSIYLFGDYILTDMLGPVMDKFLNHYHFDFVFHSPLDGQNTYSLMQLDFR